VVLDPKFAADQVAAAAAARQKQRANDVPELLRELIAAVRDLRERPIQVCLDPKCARALLHELEERLITTRGVNVRASATCQQPVSSDDVDIFDTSGSFTAGAAIGTKIPLCTKTLGGVQTVIKGIGWQAAVVSPGTTNPYSCLKFTLKVNGAPVAPYVDMKFTPSLNLVGLTACQVLLKEGDTVAIEVEKYAASGDAFQVGARLKGWSYTPTQNIQGVLGTQAF